MEVRRGKKFYPVISPLRAKFILSTEYSPFSSHFQFFDEERESLFKKLKPRFVGQEVSFPSSDAALLFKVSKSLYFLLAPFLSLQDVDCDTLCKIFSNLLNIGRSMFSEVRRAWTLVVVCCVLWSRRRADVWSFCLHWNGLCACKTHPQLWALLDWPSHMTWEGWSHGAVECREKRCYHPLWQQSQATFEGI